MMRRAILKQLTLQAMESGITSSDAIREWIHAHSSEYRKGDFINAHAWALVELQRESKIEKLGPRSYRRIGHDSSDSYAVAPPVHNKMPAWARRLISRANNVNRLQKEAPFTSDDLIALWNDCGGRCAVSGLEFSLRPIGSGKAKRVFAPSLDRLEPGSPYSRSTCRLVMVGINFAMNAWGMDTYLLLARAAVEKAAMDEAAPTP